MARRDEVVIATKVFFPMSDKPNQGGLSRKHVLDAIAASLRRLQQDYVDLYQIHRFDPKTPIEETLEALHDVIKAGKARYLCASSMYARQFSTMLHAADWHGWTRFVSLQNHYNLIYREEGREMIPLCSAEGIGVIPWSALARGFLAGNRARSDGGETVRSQTDGYAAEMYYQDTDFAVADRVVELAGAAQCRFGANRAGVAAAQAGHYHTHHRRDKLPQLDEAVAALEICLTEDETRSLEQPYVPHPVLGHS